jgi:hypothetical protein
MKQLWIVLLLANTAFPATAQSFKVNGLDPVSTTPVSLSDTRSMSVHINQNGGSPSTLTGTDSRQRLRGHWIAGDGEYLFNPTRDSAGDAATLNIDYFFRKLSPIAAPSSIEHYTSTFLVLETECYSNLIPPGMLRVPVDVTTATATTYTPKITSPSRLFLEAQHNPRNLYPTAFAISMKKADVASGGAYKLLFLFGSTKNPATHKWEARDLFVRDLMKLPDFIPDYFTPGSMPAIKAITASTPFLALAGDFSQYLEYDLGILNTDKIAPDNPEVRIFPFLKGMDWSGIGLPADSRFRVLLLKPKVPVDGSLTASLESQLSDMGIGSPNVNSPISMDKGNYFVAGATELKTVIEASSDPNELTLTGLCLDHPQLTKDQIALYTATFRLHFCNEGNGIETAEEITVDGGANFGNLQVLESPSIIKSITSHSFTLNVPLPPASMDSNKRFHPSCYDASFSLETNSAGVEELRNLYIKKSNAVQNLGKIPVIACVRFFHAKAGTPSVCTNENFSITSKAGVILKNYPKNMPQCSGANDLNWPIAAAAAAAIIAFIFMILSYKPVKPA